MAKKISLFRPGGISHGVLAAVLGVVALGLMVFLVHAQLSALGEVRETVAVEQMKLVQTENRLNFLIGIRAQAPVWETRLAVAERLLPGKPKESWLVDDLQRVADRSNIELLQIRFESRVETGQGYVEMPVKLAFQGRYQELLALLGNLQNGQRAIRVSEVRVDRGREGLPQIRADITASAFHQEDEVPPTPPPATP